MIIISYTEIFRKVLWVRYITKMLIDECIASNALVLLAT